MTGFRIAIIGSGATALYCLKNLAASPQPLAITVFGASQEFGNGMPYSAAFNAEYMLCNAFSREIPGVSQSLFEWLKTLPARELGEWELSQHDISPRAFYPRVLIGDYLKDEFSEAVNAAERNGHSVSLAPGACVTDLRVGDDIVVGLSPDPANGSLSFDGAILATGHSWPSAPRLGGAELLSPWPYTEMTGLPPGNIGILGSSLSAIDAAMALAFTHGAFDDSGDGITWKAHDGSETLRITMVSKTGVMPEGDFYYPFPYLPLNHLTADATEAEIAKGPDGLLDRVFSLLLADLSDADPGYMTRLGPDAATPEGFGKAYFKSRRESGGLAAVKADFVKTRRSMRERETIPYRYVLLRASETIDNVLRALPEDQWKRFTQTLLPVLTDAYAAVPHLSLARIIALHDAGVLELRATGDDAAFETAPQGGVTVRTDDGELHFDVMIDSRGQSAAAPDALPFPALVAKLNQSSPVKAPFRLGIAGADSAPVYCLALPQLLERHPFSQGLADCARNSRLGVDDMLRNVSKAKRG